MVAVFRVEDDLRLGPYTSRLVAIKVLVHHDDLAYHPEPSNDGIRDMQDTEWCGFSSIEALLRWFSFKDRVALEYSGLHVVKIEVPDYMVRYGKRQLVFKQSPQEVHPREKISWDELVVPTITTRSE